LVPFLWHGDSVGQNKAQSEAVTRELDNRLFTRMIILHSDEMGI
jgi:hypothetical protein